ncbi:MULTISPECIES: Pr6Pr family membrane protein [unclassified Frondihabitans]|uniref:Pr6Pr family membrane protein n=1 Tax=unclassified Frondihabitans TaxID=2626248 RepID=UPI000F4D3657|nr:MULTISPECIES: Pr6Pr family membrane protein [unclassified Frondihabitans]RPE78755.1 hypothetical protein EDF37_1436 [Frondihabitans sp. PhB153]RPF09036.1 hypothetical protein EDF39_1438 [Frondihabitans sp. PhB161]
MQTPWTFRVSGLLRLAAAGVAIAALVANFEYVIGFSTFATANYFSYFTQQSNMANVAVLVVSGILTFRGRSDPPWFAAVHAIVTTYVIVSGVVFAVLVTQSASHHYALAFPTSSQVLHFWISAYVLLDWILAPGRTPVRWRTLALVLIFPLIWGLYTLERGREVRWYPYFFLDPTQVSPEQFRLYNALVLAIFVGVLTALIGLSHVRPGHLARRRRVLASGDDTNAGSDGSPERATAPHELGVGDGVGDASSATRSR